MTTIRVITTGDPKTFQAHEDDDYVGAYIGKHGELRIVSMTDPKDVNIEKKKDVQPIQRPLAIYAPGYWLIVKFGE